MTATINRQNDQIQPSAAPAAESPTGRPVLRVVGECHVGLWGLDRQERLARSFGRQGVTTADDAAAGSQADENGVVMVGAEWELSPDVVAPLVSSPNLVLAGDATEGSPARVAAVHVGAGATAERQRAAMALIGNPVPDSLNADALGLEVADGKGLAQRYDEKLRKRTSPYVLSALETSLRDIEWRTFDGAYKGVTDFVTKWVWPRLALPVTRKAADWGITPNAVTTASLVLVIAVTFLFWEGHFLLGLAGAWLMTFLDTVDGKLARVTMTSTKWGHLFDHGIDLIHPPFWWAAWWAGLAVGAAGTASPELVLALWIVVAGYVLGRIIEGLFSLFFSFEIHVWQPVDSYMRLITARRNPNLVLLTIAAIVQQPKAGFMVVAGWTAICLAFHVFRLLLAIGLKLSGRRLHSWLTEPAAAAARAS